MKLFTKQQKMKKFQKWKAMLVVALLACTGLAQAQVTNSGFEDNSKDTWYYSIYLGPITIQSNNTTGYRWRNGQWENCTVSSTSSHTYEIGMWNVGEDPTTTDLSKSITLQNNGTVDIVDKKNVLDVLQAWDNRADAVGMRQTNYPITISCNRLIKIRLNNVRSTVKDGLAFRPHLQGSQPNQCDLTVHLKGDNRFHNVFYTSQTTKYDGEEGTNQTYKNSRIQFYEESGSNGTLTVGSTTKNGSNHGGNHYNSVIGGHDDVPDQEVYGIEFYSGTIFAGARHEDNCTAIGGGGNGHGGVNIYGGTVTAVTSSTGTAIGGGIGWLEPGGVGDVNIQGGTVYAYNHGFSSGQEGDPAYVYPFNTFVPASAIGGASSANSDGNTGTVNITGGHVTARSTGGNAIGGGGSTFAKGGKGELIISGEATTVDAYSISDTVWHQNDSVPVSTSIGGGPGNTLGGEGNVTINGGEIHCGNIGGGNGTIGDGGSATVTITKGKLYAKGIGGGDATTSTGGEAHIIVSGGELYSEGIGGGDATSGVGGDASIYITGGTLNCASIGGGDATDGGTPGNVKGSEGLAGIYIVHPNNVINMATGYIGGGTNDLGAIGKATAYINAPNATIQGQFILSYPGSSPTDSCFFVMESGLIDNENLAEIGDENSLYLRANSNGAAVYMDDPHGYVNITGGTIQNCHSPAGLGGAIFMKAGQVLLGNEELTGTGVITNCDALYGGGVYMDGGKFTMKGGEISYCNATSTGDGRGGGAYVSRSENATAEANFFKGSIHHCNSERNGGGISVYQGNAFFNAPGVDIYENFTKRYGGGVEVVGDGTAQVGLVQFDNGNIHHNIAGEEQHANTGAAGVHVSGGCTFNMTGGTIHDNWTPGVGGGIHASSKGHLNLSGGEIYNNTGICQGGGINLNTMTEIVISGNVVVHNNTSLRGGAAFVDGGLLTINGGKIRNNTASKTLDTIGQPQVAIDNKGQGGAFYLILENMGNGNEELTQSKLFINGGDIFSNVADKDGGAFCVKTNPDYTGVSTVEITGGKVYDNSASNYGGGFAVYGGDVTVSGGALVGTNGAKDGSRNTAAYGGGIYMDGGTMTFSDGTIGGNYASMQGGGVFISENATLNLKGNAILTKNHVPAPDENDPEKGKGGGVYLAGTLVVGDAQSNAVCTVKAEDNYAGESYQYDPEEDLNNRNNIYLSEPEAHPYTDENHNDVITVVKGSIGSNSKIGFSVPQNQVPVIFCTRSANPSSADGSWTYLDRFTPGGNLNRVVFDDTEKYIAIHTTTNDYFDKDHVYLYGYWPEAVTHAPTGFNPTNINSKEELAWLISYVNGLNGSEAHDLSGQTVNLNADVDMKEFGWVPIGFKGNGVNADKPFRGTFKGNGHVIKGINGMVYGNDDDNFYAYGLFGNVEGGTVENVSVSGAEFYLDNVSGRFLGGMAGYLNGSTIRNCEVSSTMVTQNPNTAMGGIVGRQTAGTVHSCIGYADMKGGVMGGLVGELVGGNLYNSFTNAKFTRVQDATNNQFTGGLAGTNAGTIANCYVRLQNETEPASFGWFAGTNNGTIQYCYAPANKTNYLATTGGTLTGHGNYAGTSLVDGKYSFNHSDQQVTASNDYVENGTITNTGELKGLQATLNNWVEAHPATSGYTTWTRTMASPINDDLPILKYEAFAFAGSKDGIHLEYGTNLNTILTDYNSVEGGGSVYVYGAPVNEVSVNNDNDVKLYFGQDASINQSETNTLNARVGVTLDNSSTGFMAYDWHMFSPALTAAPLGLEYHSNNSSYYIYNHYSELSANGIESSVYNNAENMNPPATTWNDEAGHIGYFPTDTPYGYPYTTDGSFDFYCLDENTRQWINFKREGAVGTNSSTGSTFYDHWNQYTYLPTDNHKNIQYENETELVPGKGYMVALSEPSMLMADGVLNNGTVEYTATYREGDGNDYPLRGVNLVGNPFQSYLDADNFLDHNGLNTYYILDADAKGYIARVSGGSTPDTPKENVVNYEAPQYIHPHQGFLVMVPSEKKLEYTKAMRSATGGTFRSQENHYPMVMLACTDTEGRNDFATVELDRPEQGGGEKIKGLHAGDASLWFHFDDTDYQTAFTTPGLTSAPLRFKAYEDGTFTLRWNTANGEFNYLHLIDNMTGMDIDCLTTDSYSFEGKTDDYTSRFKLMFDMQGDDDENGATAETATFAFQMGDEIVVNGEGMLQLFDVNGRCLMITELYGQQNTIGLPKAAAGVYVLRLTSGESVKVQKMVVR